MAEPEKIEPSLVEHAFSDLMRRIGALSEKLDSMSEDAEERKKLEEDLKGYVAKIYEIPKHAKIILPTKKFVEFVDASRLDGDSERGVVSKSETAEDEKKLYVVKLKQAIEKIRPDVAHKINVMDSRHFNDEKHRKYFKLAKILDAFKATKGYITVKDYFSQSPKEEDVFIQIQEYIPGYTIKEVIEFLETLPSGKRKTEAIDIIVRKSFKDVFYWHENVKNNPNFEVTPEKMVHFYVDTFFKALKNAREYTNCDLRDNTLTSLELENKEVLHDILPKNKSDYTRILDSTLTNIVLRTDVPDLSKKNLDQIFEDIKEENIHHIDSRERYGHVLEDVFNIAHSYALKDIKIDGKEIFTPYNVDSFADFYMKDLKQDTSKEKINLFGMIRAMRLRDNRLSIYIPRLRQTKKTRPNYEEEIDRYVEEISYLDEKAKAHNRALIALAEKKGNKAAVKNLGVVAIALEQMSDFDKLV